jgi:pyruvate dehydrogenase E2 component (dihydrolipoamide acetyltransferase)
MPSPYAGRIARLHAAAGATVAVGSPLVTFEVVGAEPLADASGPVAATPAVRRLARDLGVDLERIAGSGPGGRITREDVEAAAGTGDGPVGEVATEDLASEDVPLSPIRRAAAARLSEAAAIPQVTTFRTVDATALEAVRRARDLSPLPVFVRALAETCGTHRLLCSSWAGDRIRVHDAVNVGVATETEAGLVVPVVRDAASLGIAAVATEIERLAGASRSGALTPPDLAGATIAVSNTGSYGSEYGTPLLNPGHAVTVALGVIRPRALVVDGRVEARPACTISLTFDHRVLDGATVGRALGALVELLESRERLEALPR